MFHGINLEKKKEELLKSSKAKPIIDDIISKADAALEKTYTHLKMSEFMLYFENGNRSIYQKTYHERRKDCSYVSIAYWLSGDAKYRNTLFDLIYMICDEYTWCVPAHTWSISVDTDLTGPNPTVTEIMEVIDLFAAETARLMSEVCRLLKNDLPPYVTARIKHEIGRRIITPMKKYDFPWKRMDNNWSAVCAGSVASALFCFGTKDDVEEILPQLRSAMEVFLGGFGKDGCCREGYNYWDYGFGNFVSFVEELSEYTDSEPGYYNRDIVKKIAMYPQRVRMNNDNVVSFSDGMPKFRFSTGLMSILRKIYGKEFLCPDLKYGNLHGTIYSVRELLWFDTNYESDELEKSNIYYDEAQWYISKKKKFSFAAKGGHNEEMHNHNDLGSFMIVCKDGTIPLADFGRGVYDMGNFHPDHRFERLVNSSRGHSVPIINGEYQVFGKEHAATNVVAGDDFFSLNIEKAYNEGVIDKLNRKFELDDDGITLTDTFVYSKETKSVTERMVSHIQPTIGDGCVNFASAKVLFDSEKYTASVSTEIYLSHGDAKETCAYLVDFKPIQPKETEFKVRIEL